MKTLNEKDLKKAAGGDGSKTPITEGIRTIPTGFDTVPTVPPGPSPK